MSVKNYKKENGTLSLRYEVLTKDETEALIKETSVVFYNATGGRVTYAVEIPNITELVKMSDNKFQKIKRLHELQLQYSVLPLSTISFNGELIGYEMIEKTNMNPIWFGVLTLEEIIYYLNKIKKF